MKVWIINIGNEILIGKVVNTNATWLARNLTQMGFEVNRIICIPDDEKEIIETLRLASERADIIITTGGLGPTFDDMTSECIAKAFNLRWVINSEALREVEEKYRKMGMALTKHRIKMAKMPEGSEALPNSVGTAPGIYLERDGTIIIALPGVPDEMKAIFDGHVRPRLQDRFPIRKIVDETYTLRGIPESGLAPIIEKVMKEVDGIYIKSHPKGHETKAPLIELHIIAYGDDEKEAQKKIEITINKIKEYTTKT